MDSRPPPPARPVAPARPPAVGGVLFLAGTVACVAVLAVVCTGLGFQAAASAIDAQIRTVDDRLETRRKERAVFAEADAVLGQLADHLDARRALEREYPPVLPELPPEDPWGTRLRYERLGPARVELRSAGPDGEFGTDDDRILPLPRD